MQKIESTPKNLKQLLQNAKYTIHYYQREYRWQEKHIEELIDDLTTEFLANYKPDHKRADVQNYGAYFMGSIIIAGREKAIIDGQQRLSSLTLLLMYLNNRLRKNGNTYDTINQMIFSETYGEKSFNINVAERQTCMETIFQDGTFNPESCGESVKNLWERYNDIFEKFPETITDDMLLHFCDWLIEKVFFVEIVAETDQDAQRIFVTMNDRGLNLTPTEMLKGYLLSEIEDDNTRKNFNDLWKDKIAALKKDDDRGDEVFIKAWLRAQYTKNEVDYELIGGAFHKWVRDNHENLNLKTSADYENFIKNFFHFIDIYFKIKKAENHFAEETKYVYYNAQLNFTLQPQLLMSAVDLNDDENIVIKKLNLTARYIDLFINSKVTNYHSVARNIIERGISSMTREIRALSINDLKLNLKKHYDDLKYDSNVIQSFVLNNFTKRYVKNILARITSFIEEQTGVKSNYIEYMKSQGKNPFEVEHIICNDFEKFRSVFSDKEEYTSYRNSIGALLLLRKSINASLSNAKYKIKRSKYGSTDGNIFAASLVEDTYHNNPRFKKFMEENNLSFEPYSKFGKTEIKKRVELVIQLVNLIWNTKEFENNE